MPAAQSEVTVHVIIPARNEEDSLGRCLESLAGQQGISFRITVVDDGSTDRTRAIAESYPGVEVLSAPEPPPGVMGKCNALIAGARGSLAKWLLLTDADTFHLPGSLAAAVREAEERRVDLLSYSPEQEVVSFAERILMPLVFADLVREYPPERVNDPQDPVVAANGQYILVRRIAYEELGGHQCVADNLLEDVALARIFKASNHPIWFRFGGGIVRTRMYRSFHAMTEGWTKNLALLFRHPVLLAALRSLEFVVVAAAVVIDFIALANVRPDIGWPGLSLTAFFYLLFIVRISRAHFPWSSNLLAWFGLPLYVSLLLRSYLHSHRRGAVTWKGRTYPSSAPGRAAGSSTQGSKSGLKS